MLRTFILTCFFLTHALTAQEFDQDKYIDSLKRIIDSDTHDSLKVKALLNWDYLIYISDPELDVALNRQVIALCDKNLNWLMPPRDLQIFADRKANACNNLGLALMNYADYDQALMHLTTSLELSTLLGQQNQVSNAQNNIALVYKAQRDFGKALRYFEQSIANDSTQESLGAYHNNVGLCYDDMEKFDIALAYYDSAIRASVLAGDEWTLANAMANKAYAHFHLGETDTAIALFNQVVVAYERLGDQFGLSFVYFGLGSTYIKANKPREAIALCLKGLDIARRDSFLERQRNNCDCLYLGYKAIGDKENALKYLEEYNIAREAYNTAQNAHEIALSEARVEFENQRLRDSLNFAAQKTFDAQKHESELQAKRVQQWYLYVGLGLLIIIALIVLRSYYLKRKDNLVIATQKAEVERQNILVEHKNQEITDSINYAKTIQDALLPSVSRLQRMLGEHFVLYLPKDIVAGDFFWAEEIGQRKFFAVADCTGHGVPGAMVSVLCHNALARSVKEFGLIDPAAILEQCRKIIAEDFSDSSRKVNDGMDISLCVMNGANMHFSGANNNLIRIRDGALTEFQADKQPVGLYQWGAAFTSHQIEIRKNDWVYLFTDGYADQFGGDKGKKYKYKIFKEFLVKNHIEPANVQLQHLTDEFVEWKGDLEQVDDICVMGIKMT